MKEYSVTLSMSKWVRVHVNADSREEAEDLAMMRAADGDYEDLEDEEVDDIQDVEEINYNPNDPRI